MAEHSSIEWTDATWNPVTGCSKISTGCKNCYAEKFAERFRGVAGHPYQQGFDLKLWPDRLDLPLSWKRPRMIFVNSMSDLFHEAVPHAFIDRVFDTMTRARAHTFQVLTKRPDRMATWSTDLSGSSLGPRVSWPHNVWAGTSVENEETTHRVLALRAVPARTRFLSIEPLLGRVRLTARTLAGVHWVIVGGESGPRARKMDPAWVREIRDRCLDARVPFFFKQWGGVRKKQEGRELDGRTWDELPYEHQARQLI
jgi:protein gp37